MQREPIVSLLLSIPCAAAVEVTLYWYLRKKLQCTCTQWLDILNTGDEGRRKTCVSCQKHESLGITALSSFHLSPFVKRFS